MSDIGGKRTVDVVADQQSTEPGVGRHTGLREEALAALVVAHVPQSAHPAGDVPQAGILVGMGTKAYHVGAESVRSHVPNITRRRLRRNGTFNEFDELPRTLALATAAYSSSH